MQLFTKNLFEKFAKNTCIVDRNGSEERIYLYSEVFETISKVCLRFEQLEILPSVGFAVKLKDSHTAGSIVVTLSILYNRCHFCPVEKLEFLEDYGTNLLISNCEQINHQYREKLMSEILVFHEKFFLYNMNTTGVKNALPKNMCYSIGTSGSTGNPKIVHVPWECIMPNIHSLCTRFKINSSDVIFLGTPMTFDPFAVELFMAIMNGSALLITTSEVRLSPQKLLNVLWPKQNIDLSTTILQMTPSLFRLFGQDVIRNKILGGNTTLRILVLGGEEFPSAQELKTWLPESGILDKRIFNIYGITEVSCWSAIHELKSIEILENSQVPIGEPLDDETTLIIDEIEKCSDGTQCGELLIGSKTRKTYVPQKDKAEDYTQNERKSGILYRNTGDLFERDLNGHLFYRGRLNHTIKRMGKRINLDVLEKKIESLFNTVANFKAICLWNSNEQSLICCLKLFIDPNTDKPLAFIKKAINEDLEDHEKPD